MRVTTAFNRILRLPGAAVVSVAFTGDGMVLGIRAKARLHTCPCGRRSRARYDTSTRRWRHLDMAGTKLWLEADIARVDCKACGRVRTEEVPWARAGAWHTRDFEDVVAWLAQRTDMTTITKLLRCSWEAVNGIAKRVVVEHLTDDRLNDLFRIGVDEVSYRFGHQYLTIVADHGTGAVVYVAKGKRGAALEAFFDELGEERCARVEAISMDLGTTFRDAAARRIPQATICFDPYHVMQIMNRALDAVFKAHGSAFAGDSGRIWRATRVALRSGAEGLNEHQRDLVNNLRRSRYQLFRAWELKEELRYFYKHVAPNDAVDYLKAWITRLLRSRIRAYRNLAKQMKHNFDRIVAAVQLGLSNARLEGINARVRIIQRRGHGYKDVESLIAMIHLCLGGITLELPTQA